MLTLPNSQSKSSPTFQPTERDMELYRAIVTFKETNDGNTPGNRELMVLCGMGSTSVVNHHMQHLIRAGLISREHYSHNLRVTGGRWTLSS